MRAWIIRYWICIQRPVWNIGLCSPLPSSFRPGLWFRLQLSADQCCLKSADWPMSVTVSQLNCRHCAGHLTSHRARKTANVHLVSATHAYGKFCGLQLCYSCLWKLSKPAAAAVRAGCDGGRSPCGVPLDPRLIYTPATRRPASRGPGNGCFSVEI